MKYLIMIKDWIVEAIVDGLTVLAQAVLVLVLLLLLIIVGYFMINMNCYAVGDMPIVCNMVDNHGLLRELYEYILQ